MKWKAWAPLAVAVVLGLVAWKVALKMVNTNDPGEQASDKYTQVVVAKHPIAPGDAIGPDDVMMGPIASEGGVPDGAFASVPQVTGRVATISMVRGQAVTETVLAPQGAAAGLQALVPAGMRAVTIEVNEVSGLAGLLTPGSHVDVVSTVRDAQTNESVACTIMENIKVQAIGQRMSGGVNKDEPSLPKTVTVIATPAQAEAMELATSTGRIRLVLRNSSDEQNAGTTGMTVADLRMGTGGNKGTDILKISSPTTRPAKDDPSFQRVKIIRNGVESTVTVEYRRPASIMTGTDLDAPVGSNAN